MRFEDKLWVLKDADDGSRVSILPKMANRHGLIAGATGTGKTVSLKVLAESFSEMGVPVFLSDVKGDLAGCCEAGADSEDMRKRIDYFGLEGTGFQFRSFPVQFFDLGCAGCEISPFGNNPMDDISGLFRNTDKLHTELFKESSVKRSGAGAAVKVCNQCKRLPCCRKRGALSLNAVKEPRLFRRVF